MKPSWEDGSIGIDAGSVVKNVKEMMERVQYIQDEFDSPALIEEYIEGREIYAGILGTTNARKFYRWSNSIFRVCPRARRKLPATT